LEEKNHCKGVIHPRGAHPDTRTDLPGAEAVKDPQASPRREQVVSEAEEAVTPHKEEEVFPLMAEVFLLTEEEAMVDLLSADPLLVTECPQEVATRPEEAIHLAEDLRTRQLRFSATMPTEACT
jgi:hypothetical protein